MENYLFYLFLSGALLGVEFFPLQGCLPTLATVREKYLENENFFQVREKSENFVDGQGNLERNWKVREKSGNSKINDYGRQIYSVQEGKICTFS